MVQGPIFQLADWGVFNVILPFILVFAIVYAVLHKTKVLGKESKNFNVIIALVMGFSIVVPHVLYGTPNPADKVLQGGFIDLVEVINHALPQVSVLLVAILMVLLVFGIWGSKVKLGENSLSGIIALVSFLAIIFIFGNAAGWWQFPYWINFWLSPETQALVVTILVFAIIIWFVTKDDKPKEAKEGPSRFGKFMTSVLEDAD